MAAFRHYLAVWQVPGAPLLTIASVIARLGIGMVPLALLLLVADTSDSYAVAGIAGGVYALASAACAPVAGRIADRVGPSPVLLTTAIAHPLALGAVLVANSGGRATLPLMYLATAVAGATYPPLTAAIRGAWSDLTGPGSGREGLRSAALAEWQRAQVQLTFRNSAKSAGVSAPAPRAPLGEEVVGC